MNEMLKFDLKSYSKNWKFLLLIVSLIVMGIFVGGSARFTLRENLAYNSPYQIAFITAFFSLTSIFFGTIVTSQLALKETDSNFNLIYFSLPISKKQFLWSRFVSILTISFLFTFIFSVSFFIGREMVYDSSESAGFNLLFYLLPFLIFTIINTLLVVAITSAIAWFTKSKMFVYVGGLMLYVFYMVVLLFSGSPFMANQLPQSKRAQFLSAILDPFGISAFFYQTSHLSIEQRNTEVVDLNGILLGNRIAILLIAALLLYFSVQKFSSFKKVRNVKPVVSSSEVSTIIPFAFVSTKKDNEVKWQSLISFTKIHWIYIVKSIPFVLILLSLLFAVGMEMYAEIEKGIRLPQKYASSGLMVSTIIQNFYVLGALVMVFYSNDLYWRSKNSNFHLIEESTANNNLKFWSLWLTLIGLSITFTLILIAEGIAFQFLYNYPVIEWNIYAKVIWLVTFPLLIVSGLTLFIQKLFSHKYLGLAVAVVIVLILTSSIGKTLLKHPLLKFLQTISFDYSDMNAFGLYEYVTLNRFVFGLIIVLFLIYTIHQNRNSVKKISFWIISVFLLGIGIALANQITSGYKPKNNESVLIEMANYEKKFRVFQNKPQPTITKVVTTVDLFPTKSSYVIKGNYVLENKTQQPIDEIVFNFTDDFIIEKAVLQFNGKNIAIEKQNEVVKLKKPLLPGQEMLFDFELYYAWKPINGHQSFNAMVDNGSFMRISRYYPQIGYDSSNEIEDEKERNRFGLGKPTTIKKLESPKVSNNDFIDLDITVSTDANQTVIGVGELVNQWKANNRNIFHFKAIAIPFRFAISSANYKIKKEIYKGKSFEVYYHPLHYENVEHLIKNAKITMDYCENNFGKYPFQTIRFAEISGFTKGFNATAYPATIYMSENMAFHCNILADKRQDVINELAGHELAHLWWGNSQIDPDNREGDVMLTETLAMYTELMLLKKMYGKKKAEEAVAMHQDIYESEKGLSGDVALIKVTSQMTHVSYSKGAVAMYKLSELIGEDQLNLALRNFLNKYKYPNDKPISTDFLKEVYQVSDKMKYKRIKELFE
ncbi:conserved membrane hypothetical protein [Flavobacterium sp. 9AF]|uniref:ABC transporter permease/M1 family aminopeptidase n=1 Tax=Flavobacterium sp. 9AF TaxID=2653142 RepID=UPI0012F05235|nr:M1 family aminopeptidase [Flavobacterium sp. 9AF]VXA92360.1 conserved membrane hypothetical protein [Flavobacterium sp. 9AF]